MKFQSVLFSFIYLSIDLATWELIFLRFLYVKVHVFVVFYLIVGIFLLSQIFEHCVRLHLIPFPSLFRLNYSYMCSRSFFCRILHPSLHLKILIIIIISDVWFFISNWEWYPASTSYLWVCSTHLILIFFSWNLYITSL